MKLSYNIANAIIAATLLFALETSCSSNTEEELSLPSVESPYPKALPTGKTEIMISQGEILNIKGEYFPHIKLCTTAPLEEIGTYTWYEDIDGSDVFQYRLFEPSEWIPVDPTGEPTIKFRPEDLLDPKFDRGDDGTDHGGHVFIHQAFEYQWLKINHSPFNLQLRCDELSSNETDIYIVFEYYSTWSEYTYNNVLKVSPHIKNL